MPSQNFSLTSHQSLTLKKTAAIVDYLSMIAAADLLLLRYCFSSVVYSTLGISLAQN